MSIANPAPTLHHEPKTRRLWRDLHALVPREWETPLLVRIPPHVGWHDVADHQIYLAHDAWEMFDDFRPYVGMPQNGVVAILMLLGVADEDGIVLNPADRLMVAPDIGPRRARTLLWVLHQAQAVR